MGLIKTCLFVSEVGILLLCVGLYTFTILHSQNNITPSSTTTTTCYREDNLDPYQIEGIKQNLWRKGNYGIMSLLLAKELPNIKVPNNSTITIFAPTDNGFRFEPRIDLQYQFVRAKVEKQDIESGKLARYTNLPTYYGNNSIVQISGPRKNNPRVSLNGVGIRDWDLYNDGRVIVHGVDYFFDTQWIQKYRTNHKWDSSINAYVEYLWHPDPEMEDSGVSPRGGVFNSKYRDFWSPFD